MLSVERILLPLALCGLFAARQVVADDGRNVAKAAASFQEELRALQVTTSSPFASPTLAPTSAFEGDRSAAASFLEELRALQATTSSPVAPPTFAPTTGFEGDRSPTLPPAASPSTANPPPSSTNSNVVYTADYKARFQLILTDVRCTGYKPLINVYCFGEIEVLSRSSSTIKCTKLSTTNEGFSGYLCTNTCVTREACEDVYLVDGLDETASYGEIDFRCSGNNPAAVDGAMIFEGADDNSCRSTTTSEAVNQVFHMAQLGVECDGEMQMAGDYYMECDEDDLNGIYSDGYTCYAGKNCEQGSCTFDIDDVIINVDVARLGNSCIKTSDGSTLPPGAIAETAIQNRPAGTYTARFQTNWQLDLSSGCDSDDFPSIILECDNGEISALEPSHSSTECEIVSGSTAECTDTDGTRFKDRYSGVSFNCTATGAIPTARSEYPETYVSCSSAPTSRLNAARLQMGVNCSGRLDYDDYNFECELGDEFDFEDQNYVCVSAVIHPGGSTDEIIEKTVVFTDHEWANTNFDECFDFYAPDIDPPDIDPPFQIIEEDDDGGSSFMGAVIGGLVAVLVLVGLGLGIFCCLKKRNKNNNDAQAPQAPPQPAHTKPQQPMGHHQVVYPVAPQTVATAAPQTTHPATAANTHFPPTVYPTQTQQAAPVPLGQTQEPEVPVAPFVPGNTADPGEKDQQQQQQQQPYNVNRREEESFIVDL